MVMFSVRRLVVFSCTALQLVCAACEVGSESVSTPDTSPSSCPFGFTPAPCTETQRPGFDAQDLERIGLEPADPLKAYLGSHHAEIAYPDGDTAEAELTIVSADATAFVMAEFDPCGGVAFGGAGSTSCSDHLVVLADVRLTTSDGAIDIAWQDVLFRVTGESAVGTASKQINDLGERYVGRLDQANSDVVSVLMEFRVSSAGFGGAVTHVLPSGGLRQFATFAAEQ